MVRQASVKVLELIAPIVEGLGYELVGVEHLPQGKHSLLRIYIDKPESGVGVEDCEKVSRQVSSMLDVEDPVSGQYALEVSSPGLDRPLFQSEHFERFVGQVVKLQLSMPVNGRRKWTGTLMGVEEGIIKIESENEVVDISFDDVDKARLVPDFG
ncbi:ribosome maturation factor RimP [Pseudomonadota bacterium]